MAELTTGPAQTPTQETATTPETQTPVATAPEVDNETKPEGGDPEVLPTGETAEEKREREKGFTVPKYRFDAVRARENKLIEDNQALVKQLEEASAAQVSPPDAAPQATQVAVATTTEDEIKRLSAKHAEAIYNGDTEAAAIIQTDLLGKIAAQNNTPQAPPIDRDAFVNEALSRFEVSRIADQLESMYPQLDKASPQFDEAINKDVLEIYEGLTLRGDPPADALARAADMVLAARGIQSVANVRGVTDKVAAASEPGAITAEVGTSGSSDQVNMETLSADEWAALPEAARNKMLGIAAS